MPNRYQYRQHQGNYSPAYALGIVVKAVLGRNRSANAYSGFNTLPTVQIYDNASKNKA
ncbi:hypothetical protein Echvi_3387 [Echinicola vietnamensis DSM 17526]|uniref:Uncharacterized protein n=1 Tax=Echinicola vietnamensis (strain DSM 17526 / LMG 23754 / KMM 6221) TaxID=926556 RepID=L0G255_ECHVK|nr:hypothetical protein Echvi_3387 [Echinicola vietnamensis DSM 17526]